MLHKLSPDEQAKAERDQRERDVRIDKARKRVAKAVRELALAQDEVASAEGELARLSGELAPPKASKKAH